MALKKYKETFLERWDKEKFKWEAVKLFQEHWDINAENFSEMFARSTEKINVLLTSTNNFPRKMIIQYAEEDAEAVRAMFINLYDESKEISERLLQFQSDAQDLCERLSPGSQHYQRPMVITVYLWLKYPNKYDVFKYSVCKETSVFLENDFKIIMGHTDENVRENAKLIDTIRDAINEDKELITMFESSLDDSCYKDESHRILAFDVSFYIAKYLASTKSEKSEWFGTNYNTGITVEIWKELFKDEEIFNVNSWEILYRMFDYGGMATCKQLSLKYGKNINFYNSGATALGKRIANKLGLDVSGNEKNEKYWMILFIGRYAKSDEDGSFLWKLRDELAEALKSVDFSDVELYANHSTPPISGEQKSDKYDKEDFLSEVYMTSEKYDKLKGLLLNKKNVIIQGAPGVGKTFAATRLAYSIMGIKDETRVEFIQFHQNYSYEDFIMGYKPSGEGFELQSGVFYKFCQKAASELDSPYFFIIDEINRGNMSKIFGELLMLIEKDYRGKKITLAYNGITFSVPKNLYIIGMMNTADRSLALIDYALRRRFSFFAMEPAFKSEGFREYMKSFDNDTFEILLQKITDLYFVIAKDPSLGNGFCIGDSYFCGQDECSDEWMQSVVEYDILPMLEEYWFDEPEKLQKWQNILRGVFNY